MAKLNWQQEAPPELLDKISYLRKKYPDYRDNINGTIKKSTALWQELSQDEQRLIYEAETIAQAGGEISAVTSAPAAAINSLTFVDESRVTELDKQKRESCIGDQSYCLKCKRIKKNTNFYRYKDGRVCEVCKECLTMHINPYDPSTFLYILEGLNFPYVEWEWNSLRDEAYESHPDRNNAPAIFGKYTSKMRLSQWKNKTWADNEAIAEEWNERREAQLADIEEFGGEVPQSFLSTIVASPSHAPQVVSTEEVLPIPDLGAELTKEDKVQLSLKWGRLYMPEDWIYLEQKYIDFKNSFDIQGAAREDTLIQICKLSLKLNQALDSGDIDSYSKLARAYDTLMKSAKFTEAQNKEESSSDFDSIGNLVKFCEREGGAIPKYHLDVPQDVIDTIIEDNQRFLRNLVCKETNLTEKLDTFLRKREQLMDLKIDKLKGLDTESAVTAEDYEEYYKFLNEDELELNDDEIAIAGEDLGKPKIQEPEELVRLEDI